MKERHFQNSSTKQKSLRTLPIFELLQESRTMKSRVARKFFKDKAWACSRREALVIIFLPGRIQWCGNLKGETGLNKKTWLMSLFAMKGAGEVFSRLIASWRLAYRIFISRSVLLRLTESRLYGYDKLDGGNTLLPAAFFSLKGTGALSEKASRLLHTKVENREIERSRVLEKISWDLWWAHLWWKISRDNTL